MCDNYAVGSEGYKNNIEYWGCGKLAAGTRSLSSASVTHLVGWDAVSHSPYVLGWDQSATLLGCRVLGNQGLSQWVPATNPEAIAAVRCQTLSSLPASFAGIELANTDHQNCSSPQSEYT